MYLQLEMNKSYMLKKKIYVGKIGKKTFTKKEKFTSLVVNWTTNRRYPWVEIGEKR